MTDQPLTSDGGRVLTLQELINKRRDERGWSYRALEARSGHKITHGRWQQLATAVRMKEFVERDNIPVIADVLEVDQTTVILAVAQSLGLDVRWRGPDLAALMPSGTDRLSEPVRDAILGVIRASVTEALAHQDDPSVLEWGKTRQTGQTGTQSAQRAPRTGHAGGVTEQ